MKCQPTAMVSLSATHVTSMSSPADALCDQELTCYLMAAES